MNQLLDCPLAGLDFEFPATLHVLHHTPSGKFGCYCHQGINGLAVFSTTAGAARFGEWIDLSGMVVQEVSFDEARLIAQDRPMPIVCLMLLDDLGSPQIHYVR